jgi:hypothetical protein
VSDFYIFDEPTDYPAGAPMPPPHVFTIPVAAELFTFHDDGELSLGWLAGWPTDETRTVNGVECGVLRLTPDEPSRPVIVPEPADDEPVLFGAPVDRVDPPKPGPVDEFDTRFLAAVTPDED